MRKRKTLKKNLKVKTGRKRGSNMRRRTMKTRNL